MNLMFRPPARLSYLAGLGALTLSMSLWACATTTAHKAEDQAKLSAVDYWPLQVGNRWTYRVTHAGASQENTVEIVQQDPDGFFVDNQGARLKHHPAGIFDGDRFLLRDPLELGAKWMAVPSANALERFEITSVGFELSVPAGKFKNCVQVQAQNKISEKERFVGEWTYAPGVGLIAFNSRREISGQQPQIQTRMQLLKFEPAAK